MANVVTRKGQVIREPVLVEKLLNSPLAGWLWVLPRIWVGWQWITASEHKIADPKWVVTGEALKGFWANAVAIPETGRPAITFDWYRSFLQFMLNAQAYTWFAKVIAYGELLVGVALVLGAFAGIAAFFGGFMNFNFMLAGSASINPMLFAISVGLIMAWKISGYIGADYFLLPWLGTPWGRKAAEPGAKPATVPEAAGAD